MNLPSLTSHPGILHSVDAQVTHPALCGGSFGNVSHHEIYHTWEKYIHTNNLNVYSARLVCNVATGCVLTQQLIPLIVGLAAISVPLAVPALVACVDVQVDLPTVAIYASIRRLILLTVEHVAIHVQPVFPALMARANCPTGGLCNNGACQCPTGFTNCSNICVNTQTNTTNCGGCGTTVKFATQVHVLAHALANSFVVLHKHVPI
ncbi:hypothetical protein TSTA_011960 [Talaromyces stipitatus ATCC 10500]|uniref:Uncharacterized protein n=1 Tax=Talaromyces stipitatus (strain ATCC 10500 / CBS 375.48 / QM 6759 / NRRL 1006) TaxID=441959 RepID=B8ME10_TALSN|nr:uncharacterized protein TSTA_011960 [Talaromyces stipitatus ATCC 10500]EED16087.1 hypothetical protein TSTA_011960 [Talaromyces stipitatus ATCC 10500]